MDAVTPEIQDRFEKSWLATQKFYNDLIDSDPGFNKFIPLFLYIQKLKQAGENKNFRLGAVTQDLIISRSAELILSPVQKFIRIKATENSFVITLSDAKKMYRQYTIKDLDDERLTGLLQTLKQELID